MISLYDFLMEASQAEKIKYIKTNIDSIDSRPDLVDYIYNKMTLGELTKEQIDKFKKHLDDIGLGKHVNAIMRYFNDVEIREFIEYIDNPDNMVPITHIVDVGGGVRRGNLKKVLDPGNKYSSDLFFDLFNNTEKPNKGPAGSGGNAAVGKCEHMLHFFIRNAKESINNTGDVTADGIHVEVKDNGGRISSNGKSLGNEACAIELKRSLAQYGVNLDDDNPFGGIKVTPKIFDRIYNELKSKDKFCECLVNAMNANWKTSGDINLMTQFVARVLFKNSKYINDGRALSDCIATLQMYMYSVNDKFDYYLLVNGKLNFIAIPTNDSFLNTMFDILQTGEVYCGRLLSIRGGHQNNGIQLTTTKLNG